MFSGTTVHSVDAKGRIVLPQKFREELGEEFYVTNGFSEAIFGEFEFYPGRLD